MGRIVKAHWPTMVFVLVLAAVVFTPPAVHGYIFPSGGDDTARHLAVLDRVEFGQFAYEPDFEYHRYGAQTFAAWIRDLSGMDVDTFFLWFNFAVMFGIGLTVFAVIRLLSGSRWGGMMATAITMFGVGGMVIYFGCGTIFHIMNMYIIGLLAVLSLALWLAGRGHIYGLLALLAFAFVSVMHIITAVYCAAAVPVALGGLGLYRLYRHQWDDVKRLAIWGAIHAALSWGLILMTLRDSSWVFDQWYSRASDMLIPEFVEGQTLLWAAPSYTPMSLYPVMIAPVLVVLALAVAALVLFRRQIVWTREVRMALLVLSAFVLVLAVGTRGVVSLDAYRFALDLGIVIALFTGLLVAVVARHDDTWRFTLFGTPVILLVCLPLVLGWCNYNSSIRPVDLEVFEYLRTENVTRVELSTQIAPWVYTRFTDGIEYVTEDPEMILYRSVPMTHATRPGHSAFWHIAEDGQWTIGQRASGTEEAEYEGKPILARFDDGTVYIVVYAAGNPGSVH